jgi:hypothetical protein
MNSIGKTITKNGLTICIHRNFFGKGKKVVSIFEEMMNELKNDFSAALGKDRLYHKPSGFLND